MTRSRFTTLGGVRNTAPAGALLQQTRHRKTMDQGRQAGGRDEAAKLPPFPGQPGAAVAELYRLQPWQSVAAVWSIGGVESESQNGNFG